MAAQPYCDYLDGKKGANRSNHSNRIGDLLVCRLRHDASSAAYREGLYTRCQSLPKLRLVGIQPPRLWFVRHIRATISGICALCNHGNQDQPLVVPVPSTADAR
jgi:hypothetical protein